MPVRMKWPRLRYPAFLTLEHGSKRLLGESLREIGVLLMVFVPLDGYLRDSKGQPAMIQSAYLRWLNALGSKSNIEILAFGVLGIAFLCVGIKVERDAELAMQEGP